LGSARPIQPLSPEDEAILALTGPKRRAALNRLLFPGPTKDFEEGGQRLGELGQHDAEFGEARRDSHFNLSRIPVAWLGSDGLVMASR
jgi:hypothetical protein